ncbi:MAG: cysS [Candidatus Taylorbacteria bacterium]|nr:cysS [Candidatus Taylorbacteria bacterium]
MIGSRQYNIRMDILIHNTLSGKKEVFKPLVKGRVSMYQCGLTVYDTGHIGNFRTFIMGDIIRRTFEYRGYFVTQVTNITDVDDKTIRRSREEKTSLLELTRRYEALYFEDMESLNILMPHRVLRATDHVKDMIEMISTLLEKGFAYPSKDGIYFSIGKSAEYGALARLDKISATANDMLRERISNDEYEKENPRDFALWKFESDADRDGEKIVSWDAPFGKGRPGWHIECSAMATRALGDTIDIHTGATDLIFPHHTNEIAQSEAATGKRFVNYWIHGAFMNVNDAKMSKSKGNFIKIADLEAETISPLSFRYWLLTSHYHTQVNFTADAVKAAQHAFIRLAEAYVSWPEGGAADATYADKFSAFISDDFDMPKAIALVWELAKDKKVSDADKRATLLDFDRVFGLGFDALLHVDQDSGILAPADVPIEIQVLAEARDEARKAKDWAKADALRAEIEERGYSVQDSDAGFVIREL